MHMASSNCLHAPSENCRNPGHGVSGLDPGGLGMIQGFRIITVCWAAQSLVHGVYKCYCLAKPGCYAALLEQTGIAPWQSLRRESWKLAWFHVQYGFFCNLTFKWPVWLTCANTHTHTHTAFFFFFCLSSIQKQVRFTHSVSLMWRLEPISLIIKGQGFKSSFGKFLLLPSVLHFAFSVFEMFQSTCFVCFHFWVPILRGILLLIQCEKPILLKPFYLP